MSYLLVSLFSLWIGALIGFATSTLLIIGKTSDDSEFTGDQV